MLMSSKSLIVAEIAYIISMIFIKLSLGVFFLRLAIKPRQIWFIKALIVISTINGVTYAGYGVFQCGNPGGQPELWVKIATSKCLPESYMLGFGYTHAIVNAVTDALFVAFPIWFLRGSSNSRREKFMISGMLMLGAM